MAIIDEHVYYGAFIEFQWLLRFSSEAAHEKRLVTGTQDSSR